MTEFEERLKKMYQGIHAGLLKEAQVLQEQRAAKLQQAAEIEKVFGFSRRASIKLEHIPTADYEGAVESIDK